MLPNVNPLPGRALQDDDLPKATRGDPRGPTGDARQRQHGRDVAHRGGRRRPCGALADERPAGARMPEEDLAHRVRRGDVALGPAVVQLRYRDEPVGCLRSEQTGGLRSATEEWPTSRRQVYYFRRAPVSRDEGRGPPAPVPCR